jgi:hypothetical protein
MASTILATVIGGLLAILGGYLVGLKQRTWQKEQALFERDLMKKQALFERQLFITKALDEALVETERRILAENLACPLLASKDNSNDDGYPREKSCSHGPARTAQYVAEISHRGRHSLSPLLALVVPAARSVAFATSTIDTPSTLAIATTVPQVGLVNPRSIFDR